MMSPVKVLISDVIWCLNLKGRCCVKKCGIATCSVCKSPRLPPEVFAQTHHIPDPIPASDGHYKPFYEVYGTATTKSHHLSLIKCAKKSEDTTICSKCSICMHVTCPLWYRAKNVATSVLSLKALFHSETTTGLSSQWLHFYLWSQSQRLETTINTKWRLCPKLTVPRSGR